MLLSGYAMVDFLSGFKHIANEEMFLLAYSDMEITQHIINWFDSVDIHILPIRVKCNTYPWQYKINDRTYCGIPNRFETRDEAIRKAIVVANEMYNEKR